MEFKLAREKIELLDNTSNTYKTLKGMLEGSETFLQTHAVVIQDIINADDLKSLALQYETLLIKPMLANAGGTPESTSETTTPASSRPSLGSDKRKASRNHSIDDLVRERDENKCILTGKSDFCITNERIRKGYQVARIIPHSILYNYPSQSFIQRLAPWIPDDFFANLDRCQNAIFLNRHAHFLFGNFEWFITFMEEKENSYGNVYQAMQVVENGILSEDVTGRDPFMEDGRVKYRSSYKQRLFIGSSHPAPARHYIQFHELIARIVYMRGGAEDLVEEEDDHDDDQIYLHSGPQMGVHEKVANFFDSMKSADTLDPVDKIHL